MNYKKYQLWGKLDTFFILLENKLLLNEVQNFIKPEFNSNRLAIHNKNHYILLLKSETSNIKKCNYIVKELALNQNICLLIF